MPLPTSILDILSLDVLGLVVNKIGEDGDLKGFNSLRLVCKAMNDIVEPQAFSTVTIELNLRNVNMIEDKLTYLSSGVGPHSRWAKKLSIGRLVTVDTEDLSRWDLLRGDVREKMLQCQKKWLVPAIQGLKQVETVKAYITTQGPFDDVFCALADLPRLRNLRLSFGRVSKEKQGMITLGGLSGLSTLTLHYLPFFPSILEGAKKLISQSPALVGLDVCAYPKDLSIQLSRILPAGKPATPLSPSLRKLTISGDSVFLSAPCVPFLQSLTHLCISRYSVCFGFSFWKAMQHGGVQLESLVVSPLTQPVVDYLLSYSGLQELIIDWKKTTDGGEDETVSNTLFSSVLPKHSATLQVLGSSGDTTELDPWCITEPRLEQLFLCRMLRHLDLAYYFPAPKEQVVFPIVPLNLLLSAISKNMPHLRELGLKLTRRFENNFGCNGNAAAKYIKGVNEHFASTIHRTVFSLPLPEQSPMFSLSAVGVTFTAVKDARVPGECRFMVDDPKKVWVQADDRRKRGGIGLGG